jgi:hypothetical protein
VSLSRARRLGPFGRWRAGVPRLSVACQTFGDIVISAQVVAIFAGAAARFLFIPSVWFIQPYALVLQADDPIARGTPDGIPVDGG